MIKALLGAIVTLTFAATGANAQDLVRPPESPAADASNAAAAPALPPGYVIGADDVLSIVYWREKEMSAEVTVRPDGKVALPLINDLHAAGLSPEAFRDRVIEAARRFIEAPNPTVMVKEIKSRRVFITGQVEKPGTYQLNHSVTVLQLIAMAGGLKEFARGKNISVIRTEGGESVVHHFNYQEALDRKNLRQNIELKPGDTVLVP
jgi:polysaccharide export outer membrane protein